MLIALACGIHKVQLALALDVDHPQHWSRRLLLGALTIQAAAASHMLTNLGMPVLRGRPK